MNRDLVFALSTDGRDVGWGQRVALLSPSPACSMELISP